MLQNEKFGYGVDSVLLAAFAAGETGARAAQNASGKSDSLRIADLGTGCGIVAFIVSHKIPGSIVTGIEKSSDAYERAARACEMNGLEHRVSFVNCDVKDVDGKHDCDAVVCNPPYFRRDQASLSRFVNSNNSDIDANSSSLAAERYNSRHETTADIGDFVRTAESMLRKGGDFYLVHRPDRLADIFAEMRDAGVEPKELQFVVPTEGKTPNIVLVHGVRGAGPELKILPQIAVHTADGGYTEDILRIYEKK